MKLTEHLNMMFLSRLAAEAIDQIPAPDSTAGSCKKADYLLFDRAAIIEVKGLVGDRLANVTRIIEYNRKLWDWPRSWPDSWIQEVLSRHPYGDEINKEIRDANITSIEKLFRDAHRQIADTKRTYELPRSIGGLLIANEGVDVLDPRVLAGIADILLRKKQTPNGDWRFSEIDFVLIVSTAHSIVMEDGLQHPVIESVTRPDDPRENLLQGASRAIMQAWASCLGVALDYRGTVRSAEDMKRLRFEGIAEPPII